MRFAQMVTRDLAYVSVSCRISEETIKDRINQRHQFQ